MTDTRTHPDDVDEGPDAAGPVAEDLDDLEEDYVYLPRESGMVRKVLVVLAALAVIAVALVGAGGLWVVNQVTGGDEYGEPFVVSIPEGATMANASRILEEKGVVKNATFFRYYAKYKSLDRVKAGDYPDMRAGMSLDKTIARLEAGPLPQRYTQINIPEGYQLRDIHKKVISSFQQMTDADMVAAEAGVTSKYKDANQPLEGFLFPATYEVATDDQGDEAKLLNQMAEKFDEVADDVGLDEAKEKLAGQTGEVVLTPYQVLVVASIIEKEAKLDEDRGKVARVVYNRLAQGMRLEIDATTLYCFPFKTDGVLTQSELRVDCPYNTRVKGGLPPTPIASPGKASLEAALNPTPGPWLYYVLADAEGRHFFTDDYDEFLKVRDQSAKAGLL